MCKEVEPRQVMGLLNSLYSRYDSMLDEYGVFKVREERWVDEQSSADRSLCPPCLCAQVETIGDCYFVAGGLIHEDEDGMAAVRDGGSNEDPLHAERVFMFAKVGSGYLWGTHIPRPCYPSYVGASPARPCRPC